MTDQQPTEQDEAPETIGELYRRLPEDELVQVFGVRVKRPSVPDAGAGSSVEREAPSAVDDCAECQTPGYDVTDIPEPPDGSRIEFEYGTDLYGAWCDEASSVQVGWPRARRWCLYGFTVPHTWLCMQRTFGESLRSAVRLAPVAEGEDQPRQPGDRPEWEVLREVASEIRQDDGLLPLHLRVQITAWLDRRANATESRAGRQP